MAQHCPLLFRQVDATLSRINTLFVMSGVVAYLVTQEWIILAVLIADFLLRLYGYKHFSPLQNLSLWIQRRFSFPIRMEDAGAKRLASLFGVAFIAMMAVFHAAAMEWALHAAAALYLACAALDVLAGYCIACKIYHWSKKIYPKGFL